MISDHPNWFRVLPVTSIALDWLSFIHTCIKLCYAEACMTIAKHTLAQWRKKVYQSRVCSVVNMLLSF